MPIEPRSHPWRLSSPKETFFVHLYFLFKFFWGVVLCFCFVLLFSSLLPKIIFKTRHHSTHIKVGI